MVAVVLPGCRYRPGVVESVEDVLGKALVTESTVEALGEAVLPGATGLDLERRDADTTEPGPKVVENDLRTVVSAEVLRHATNGEEFREEVDHVGARDPAIGLQHQALPRELVDHREPLDLATARRAIEDEVQAPDIVRRLGPSSMEAVGTRSLATPYPPLLQHYRTLSLPESEHTGRPHSSSFEDEKPTDSSVVETRSRASQLKHPLHERRLVGSRLRLESLTAARLIDYFACPSLGDPERRLKLGHRRSLPGRAHQCPSERRSRRLL